MSELHGKCPAHRANTNGSDSYSFNTEKNTGLCRSCGLCTCIGAKGDLIGHYGDKKWFTIEEGPNSGNTKVNVSKTNNYKKDEGKVTFEGYEWSYRDYRGVSKSTYQKFDIKTYHKVPWKAKVDGEWVEGVSDTIVAVYPNGTIKGRRIDLPKKHPAHFFAKGSLDTLFAMDKFPVGCSKKITIVEGDHFDTPSAFQMLNTGSYLNPVISIPSAKPTGKLWENCQKYLNSFEEIILAVDNDEAGRQVASEMFDLFGPKLYTVNFGDLKDANDFLEEGKGKAFVDAWWRKTKFSPAGFTAGAESWLKALEEESPYTYTPTPISEFNVRARGLVKGGITILKAPPGSGKCLGPDVPVMMFDGTIKAAKDVVLGDKLMGDDGTVRNVLGTTSGVDEMFKITPVKGDSWTCNSHHILSLYNNYSKSIIDVPIKDYLKRGNDFKHHSKQFRVPVDNFGVDWTSNMMDPYIYGVYLGDGSKTRAEINMGLKKSAVIKVFEEGVHSMGFATRKRWLPEKNCWSILIRRAEGNREVNPFIRFDTSLFDLYSRGPVEVRKKFLAGILDTDGHLSQGCYDLVQKDEKVVDAVVFAARSLGLAAYKKEVVKGIKEIGFKGVYYRVCISGDVDMLPTLRHKPKPRKQIKSVLKTGFSVESIGQGEYYGFEVDGNSRFLLGDFTVTHNSSLLRMFMHDLVANKNVPVAALMMEEMKSITARAMATQALGANVMTKEDAANNLITEDKVAEAVLEMVKDDKFVSFEVNPQDPISDTLEKCKQAVLFYNVEYIFIDHLQRLAYLAGTDSATASLTELGVKLTEFAKRKDIGIVCISHMNEDGYTKYAKSIEEEAIVTIELSRDKKSEDYEERNTSHLEIQKNRPFGSTGPAGALTYDPETTILKEKTGPQEPQVKGNTTTNNKGELKEIPF